MSYVLFFLQRLKRFSYVLQLEYPNNKPEICTESYFWVNSIIDDKPTIALCHRLGMPQDGGYVYMER